MSPERIAGEGYSYSSDIWSLGLSLLATATGENPYSKHQVYWDMAHAIQDAPWRAAPPFSQLLLLLLLLLLLRKREQTRACEACVCCCCCCCCA